MSPCLAVSAMRLMALFSIFPWIRAQYRGNVPAFRGGGDDNGSYNVRHLETFRVYSIESMGMTRPSDYNVNAWNAGRLLQAAQYIIIQIWCFFVDRKVVARPTRWAVAAAASTHA